jgi:hypothetical protein
LAYNTNNATTNLSANARQKNPYPAGFQDRPQTVLSTLACTAKSTPTARKYWIGLRNPYSEHGFSLTGAICGLNRIVQDQV